MIQPTRHCIQRKNKAIPTALAVSRAAAATRPVIVEGARVAGKIGLGIGKAMYYTSKGAFNYIVKPAAKMTYNHVVKPVAKATYNRVAGSALQ
ncbi:hypothetical protein FACS189449_07090 [Alphaproteobacteria bacterium]|nr:hypothetical protein FACS189449_07090 [Alphaproteobacteria bacterium]GHU19012.1 hypothetical protein FACS189472_08190 [Alphaproteobacteria bacterium]